MLIARKLYKNEIKSVILKERIYEKNVNMSKDCLMKSKAGDRNELKIKHIIHAHPNIYYHIKKNCLI